MALLGHEAEFHELGIGDEVQGHQVGTAFFERRVLLLERGLRVALDVLGQLAGRMADHFVHVRGQLAREAAPALRARGLVGRPGELGPEALRSRPVVRLHDVREQDRFAPVLLADLLVVRQVDPDRRDRTRLAHFDDHVDRVGGDATNAFFPIARIPGHAVLEPLGVLGQRLDRPGLALVDVEHQRLPRALDPARVHVHLDKAVDRVDRGVLVLDPGHVVGATVGRLACPVEPDERTERRGHRLGGEWHRRFQVCHDLRYLWPVLPVDPVHLFDQLTVSVEQPRVQAVTLVESLELVHRDVDVEVVRARRQDVPAGTRGLVGHGRIDARVEEHRLEPVEHLLERLALCERQRRPGFRRRDRGGGKRLRRALKDELPRGQVVIRPGVDPEQLGVAVNLIERDRVDPRWMRQDLFEHVAHLQVVDVTLVVIDVPPGQRGLIQVPDQRLLAQRERVEPIGVQLHDGRFADLLEQVWPSVSGDPRAGRGWSAFISRVARHPHRTGDQRQHDDTLNTHDHLLPFRTED